MRLAPTAMGLHGIAVGPFNAELVRSMQALYGLVLPEVLARGRPWVQLVEVQESGMSTPDGLHAFQAMLAAVQRHPEAAPVAVAHVVPPEVEGARLMHKAVVRCFESVGLPFAQFEDRASAEAWLADRLNQAR